MMPTLKTNSIQPKLEYLPQAIPIPAAQQPIPMASTNPFMRSGNGLGHFQKFDGVAVKIKFSSGWNFKSSIHNEWILPDSFNSSRSGSTKQSKWAQIAVWLTLPSGYPGITSPEQAATMENSMMEIDHKTQAMSWRSDNWLYRLSGLKIFVNNFYVQQTRCFSCTIHDKDLFRNFEPWYKVFNKYFSRIWGFIVKEAVRRN